uniref:FAD-binding PCMH-type domain-containing protein n=1 Tax=Rhizophagus irregularis (strain DAOM 181602 / DAOM 197198 / MUCL 43194) TaxID=747089 RepID=U9TZ43_RHIID
MKLIKQLDIVLLLLWCILSFNFIENVNSSLISPILPPYHICLRSIEGPVIYPSDSRFQSLIIDDNIRVNYTPSVLVYAVNNEDVKNAVKCAVKWKTDIVPRSGGHSYEKYSLGGRDNVIVLDVTLINDITINSNSEPKTAKIGAGNRLGNIYVKLSEAGFLIPAGTCPSVGIGGHALGIGYCSRTYGITCDNVISMEMVNAKGELLHIDSTSHPKLFFALRGAGGGSYGIVTSYVFHIHPAPPQATYMRFAFNRTNLAQVHQLIFALNEVGPLIDNKIGLKLRLFKTSLIATVLYLGPRTEAKNAMKDFLSKAPERISSEYNQLTFLEAIIAVADVSEYDMYHPSHHPIFFKLKSFYVNQGEGLNQAAINDLVDFSNRASCEVLTTFDLYGGKINIDRHNTSFVHRNALYCIRMQMESYEALSPQCIDEMDNFGRRFQYKINSTSSYQGFIDRSLDNWQSRYYGNIFGKLVEIKNEYDPNNLFNFPQIHISPVHF